MDKSQNQQSALLAIAVVLSLGVGFTIGYQLGYDNGASSMHSMMHSEMMDMKGMMGHGAGESVQPDASVGDAIKTIDAAHAH
jgi:hypothetical protein